MVRVALAALLLSICATSVQAQDETVTNENQVVASPSDQADVVPANIPPEVWMYMQSLKRYEDPKQAVRRKAEERSAKRRARLASQRWYGFSPLRPTASPVPFMGTAAPTWVSNTANPYHWVAPGNPRVVFYHGEIKRR